MKLSSVKIIGLSKVQANAIAILAENGSLADFLNVELERIDLESEKFENQQAAYVDFDTNETHPDHEVDFDY